MTSAASFRPHGRVADRAAVLAIACSALAALAALPACGDSEETVPDEILPSSEYAARCVNPRKGVDPTTNQAFRDVSGSALDEKLWLRSWIDDLYLWYSEVPKSDPTKFTTPLLYFNALRTSAKTPSGKDKDQFHFAIDTADWISQSQGGTEAGYGLQWALLASVPPRSLRIAYVNPGSPAATAGLERGATVISIDGVAVLDGNPAPLNAGLFPDNIGEQHTFVVRDRGASTTHSVVLTSATVNLVPVQGVHTLPAPNDHVGYMLFTDHIATAEKGLFDAITTLRTAGITDLILDLRYNTGGYLEIASQLAYEIAGPTRTTGKTFEQLTFNDKHTTDPQSGKPIPPDPFVNITDGFSLDRGMPLPYLGLSRVFVLTSESTCSASESVMNSLSGIDVEIIQIGETTCGKPYGFLPADNCGTTYFAIQFKGVNNKGFGDYADGFVPGKLLHGCNNVPDDFDHALGDPAEGRVATALSYLANGACPVAAAPRERPVRPVIPKPAWRQNRILRR